MYGKIYTCLYTVSMVGSGSMVLALWPYVIANARPDDGGSIDLNPALLAAVFGEPPEKIQDAITFLCSPDPDSRSAE